MSASYAAVSAKTFAMLSVDMFPICINSPIIYSRKVLKKKDTTDKQNLKGSDDGVQHSELLGLWTLSIFLNTKYSKTQQNWICFHPLVRGGGTHLLSWVP
jgi:hypothetical protein